MRNLFQYIEPWMFRIVFISFFLPIHLQTFIFISFFSWILYNAIIYKITLSKQEWLIALLLGGGYLFFIAYIPLTESHSRIGLYSFLERKVALFVLPFIIPITLKLSSHSFYKELKWFVYANAFFIVVVNILSFIHTMQYDNLYHLNHVEYRILFEHIGGIHPTYLGMYSCFSISILLLNQLHSIRQKLISIILQLILVSGLVLLSPKISLLILLLIYSYYLFFIASFKPLYKIMITSLVIISTLLAYSAVPFFHQRIGEVFSFLSNHPTNAIDNSVLFRQFIFQIDLNLLKDHWVFGIGPMELQHQLDNAFLYTSIITKTYLGSYNTHNEYLNQWLSFGLVGFLYFLIIYFIQVRKAIQLSNKLYLFYLVIILVSFLTENILSRQHGILFVAFFSPIFYFHTKDYHI